jgi:HNH endonuclease
MIGRPQESVDSRFWRHVTLRPGCWLWRGACIWSGYGRLPWGTTIAGKRVRKNLLAHRVSWEINYGPVPPGLLVLHRCDTPACVRPSHLFLGTQAANMADKVAKGRQNRGDTHGRRKLNEKQVRAILRAKGTEERIAQRYGITQGHVNEIRNRKAWAHVRP